MKPSIIFIIVWSLWFLSELLINRLFRSGSSRKKQDDRGSITLLWITIGFANTLGILVNIIVYAPISSHVWVSYAGLAVIVGGMILRFISIRSLGKYFTVDLAIREDHQVRHEGLYRYIRHPSYAGSLISFYGFGVSLNNWLSFLVIAVPVTLGFLYRIRLEEKLLLKTFGDTYRDYMKKTYRLIPGIY